MQNHLITNNILSLKKNLRDRGVKDNVILSFIKEELQNYILFALYTNPKMTLSLTPLSLRFFLSDKILFVIR
jgi:hypothetical protein